MADVLPLWGAVAAVGVIVLVIVVVVGAGWWRRRQDGDKGRLGVPNPSLGA